MALTALLEELLARFGIHLAGGLVLLVGAYHGRHLIRGLTHVQRGATYAIVGLALLGLGIATGVIEGIDVGALMGLIDVAVELIGALFEAVK